MSTVGRSAFAIALEPLQTVHVTLFRPPACLVLHSTDADCPLYDIAGPWNRTQTCQPSLNPGKTFSNYDSAFESYITLFINMACLYWCD